MISRDMFISNLFQKNTLQHFICNSLARAMIPGNAKAWARPLKLQK